MSLGIDWRLLKRLHLTTSQMVERAQKAEAVGQHKAAKVFWNNARRCACIAADILRYTDHEPQRSNVFLAAATFSFKCGKFDDAKGFIESGLSGLRGYVERPEDPSFALAMHFQKLRRAVFLAELSGAEAGPTRVAPASLPAEVSEEAKCA